MLASGLGPHADLRTNLQIPSTCIRDRQESTNYCSRHGSLGKSRPLILKSWFEYILPSFAASSSSLALDLLVSADRGTLSCRHQDF